MKQNIQFNNQHNQTIDFGIDDLPMLITGAEGSGASFFSVSLASYLYQKGCKLLFFTQKHLAKDQFLEQTGAKDFIEVKIEDDFLAAAGKQCIVIESGNIGLFSQAFRMVGDLSERIIFVKNIEDTLTNELIKELKKYDKLILSGNLADSGIEVDVQKLAFKTRIAFSPDRSAVMMNNGGEQGIAVKVV